MCLPPENICVIDEGEVRLRNGLAVHSGHCVFSPHFSLQCGGERSRIGNEIKSLFFGTECSLSSFSFLCLPWQ